ncbi:MAG: polysaccharide biosynthesis/export family protein [Phycisphaerae bacterium]
MTTANRCLGVLIGCLLGAAAMGCGGNNERLKAFLQEPRSPVSGSEYRVLPPDVILINSIYVSDINNFKVEVRPDGKINLPLLGEVTVAGNTPREIEAVLKARSREFYEEVDATVQVTEFRSQKIYVFGQVARPGPLPWTGTDTVIDVLAQVQPTPLAWPERIRVIRGKPPIRGGYLRPSKEDQEDQAEKSDPEEDAPAPSTEEFPVAKEGEDKQEKPLTVEEATKMAAEAARAAEAGDGSDAHMMKVNMMNMVEKGDFSQNVLLKAGDVVYVPPNPLAAFGLAMQQVLLGIQPAASTIQAPASAAYSVKSVQNFGSSKQIP